MVPKELAAGLRHILAVSTLGRAARVLRARFRSFGSINHCVQMNHPNAHGPESSGGVWVSSPILGFEGPVGL